MEISKIKQNSNFKPNIKSEEYTATLGIGSIIPCQIEAYFLALNKYIDNGSFNLDVGFGLGYGLNILAIKSKKLIGVDVDEKVYEYCKNTCLGKNPKLSEIKIYNGYDLDYPDNYFEVVTCVDVLEHVKDYERLLKEMLRVCQKGIFISTPNKRQEYTNLDGTPMNYYHLREWSFKELDKIAKKFGIVEWNFLNGPFEGPFNYSETVRKDSITLSPFIFKK
ncbi:MAG: class I SAM-dependent methyltransferase [Candidatus Humimicrobiaceae bacterium]